jgi:hypothetical protein
MKESLSYLLTSLEHLRALASSSSVSKKRMSLSTLICVSSDMFLEPPARGGPPFFSLAPPHSRQGAC